MVGYASQKAHDRQTVHFKLREILSFVSLRIIDGIDGPSEVLG